MLIDEVKIKLRGGKGGDGRVAFNKNKGEKGPTGGDGGNGGSVYLKGTSNLTALNKFRFKKEFLAEDGVDGKNKILEGKRGKDLILKVPIGTIAHNLDTGRDLEVVRDEEKVLVARGGKRGRGNYFFRSSTNTTPKEFEEGKKGEGFDFLLELRLIADVGLIGLPSAGKSSLLNILTKANVKVAAYPFTTLEPNLGDFYGLIIADIPGLIEGASSGKGLGIRFLRHIKRTRILIHCVSSESKNLLNDYNAIKNELKKYEASLLKKREYIFLTKTDLISEKEIEEKMKELKKINPNVLAVSICNEKNIERVKKLLGEIKQKSKV